jgi:hypothetical protein
MKGLQKANAYLGRRRCNGLQIERGATHVAVGCLLLWLLLSSSFLLLWVVKISISNSRRG